MTTKDDPRVRREIAQIAQQFLAVETLVARGRDQLDFYDLGVDGIRAALLAAFEAGHQSAQKDGAK